MGNLLSMDSLDFTKYKVSDSKKLIEEAKGSLRGDPLVLKVIRDELHLSNRQVEENLAVLLDFQEDIHYCASCPGFDRCDKAQPHYRMSLELDGNFVKREFCICEKAKEIQERKAKFLHCDFAEDWHDLGFSSIDSSDKDSPRGKIVLRLASFVKNDTSSWFYLKGEPGSGKSYILAAFANEYSKVHYPVAYFDSALFVEMLKNLAFSKEKHAKEALNRAISNYSRCPLLVLDGFGNEFKSEYIFSALLYPILSARAKAGLLTCFSSDFSIEDVCKEYKPKIGALRASQFQSLLERQCKKMYELPVALGLY